MQNKDSSALFQLVSDDSSAAIRKNMADAERAISFSNYSLAIILYKRAMGAHPEKKNIPPSKIKIYHGSLASCHLAIASLLVKLEKHEEAVTHFYHGYMLHAEYCYFMKDISGLIKACTNAFNYGPKEVYMLRLRAYGYERADEPDYQAAIADREMALELMNLMDVNSFEYNAAFFEYLHYELGVGYRTLKKIGKALYHFTKAIDHTLIKDYIYLSRGEMYLRLEEWNSAISDFKEVIQLNSKSFIAYQKLGIAYYNQDDFKQALEALELSLKLKKDAFTFTCIASIYAKLNYFDLAIHHYNKAINLSNDLVADDFYRRGITYLERNDVQKGDIAAAISDLKAAHALDSRRFLFWLGVAYAKQGDYDNAITTLTQASAQQSRNPNPLIKRGQLFYLKQEIELASQDYIEALDLNPNHPEANYCFGLIAFEQGDVLTANHYFQKAIDCFDKNHEKESDVLFSPKPTSIKIDALFIRGMAYYYLGKYDKACVDLSYCVAHAVNHTPAYYNNLGLVHRLLGQYEAGIQDFTQAVVYSEGALTQAYRNRALCYYQHQQYEQALEDYSTYLTYHPEDIVALNNRAGCHFKLGDYQSARDDYKKTLSLAPDDPDAAHGLKLVARALARKIGSIFHQRSHVLTQRDIIAISPPTV